MNSNNPVIQLCIEGSRAELNSEIAQASACYQQAWEIAADDYDACIAAHYVARHQAQPTETLRWNQIALDRANAVTDQRVEVFMPSLYLNMGHSYEVLGDLKAANHFYDLAAALGFPHQPDE